MNSKFQHRGGRSKKINLNIKISLGTDNALFCKIILSSEGMIQVIAQGTTNPPNADNTRNITLMFAIMQLLARITSTYMM